MELIYVTLLLVGIFLLLSILVDEYFVPSLEKISDRLALSSDVSGATLMAVGSSAPELFVALFAVFKPGGHQEIGFGSIIGSALFNLLVIVGAIPFIKIVRISWQPFCRDMLFYVLSVGFLIFVIFDGTISPYESLSMVLFYGVFVLAVVYWKKIFPYSKAEDEKEHESTPSKYKIIRFLSTVLSFLFFRIKSPTIIFFLSILYIAGISWALVELSINLAHLLHVPEILIGVTVLAVGTSLPDLLSSLIVAKNNKGDMAVSNAIGSNVFDILVGLGLPLFVYSLSFGKEMVIHNADIGFNVFFLLGTVFVTFFLFWVKKWRITKLSGGILFLLYITYVVLQTL